MTRRLDPLALGAAVLALAVLVLYFVVIGQQGRGVVAFVVVGIGLGALCAAYAARLRAPYRRGVLVAGAVLLGALGLLALLSIGFPLLLAAALCVGAAVRAGSLEQRRTSV